MSPLAPSLPAQGAAVPPTAANLVASIERAYVLAQRQGHGLVTVEHLLFALTEDPDALRLLEVNRIDVHRVQADVLSFLTRVHEDLARLFSARPEGPRPGPEMLAALQVAAQTAMASQRPAIDGALVLTALVADGRSAAAGILRGLGLGTEPGQFTSPTTTPTTTQPTRPSRANAPPTDALLQAARERLKSTGLSGPSSAPPSAPSPRATEGLAAPPIRLAPAPTAETPTMMARPPSQPPMPQPPPAQQPPVGQPNVQQWAPAPMPQSFAPPPQPAPQQAWPEPQAMPAYSPPPMPNGADQFNGHPPSFQAPQSPAPQSSMPQASMPQAGGMPHAGSYPPAGMPYPPLYDETRAPPPDDNFAPIPLPFQPTAALDIRLLAQSFPRKLQRGKPETFELSIPREALSQLVPGAFNDAYPMRPEIFASRAVSARLLAPSAGLAVEPLSPETVWIGPEQMAQSSAVDDHLRWRWHLIGRLRGTHKVQLAVQARLIGPDGLAADTPFPVQTIDVAVVQNPGRLASRIGIGLGLLVAGSLVGLVASGQLGRLLRIFG